MTSLGFVYFKGYPSTYDHFFLDSCSDGLTTLYAAGARKFIVWQTPAGESVPLVNTINELLNMVNFILRGLGAVDAQTNAVKIYTKGFVVGFLSLLHANHLFLLVNVQGSAAKSAARGLW